MQIKKGDVSFNLAFKNGEYTNKLFGRSLSLNQAGGANQLEVDFSHYAKRKRNNLEDSDFQKLLSMQGQVSHAITTDDTVRKSLHDQVVTEIKLLLGEGVVVTFNLSGFDPKSGIFR